MQLIEDLRVCSPKIVIAGIVAAFFFCISLGANAQVPTATAQGLPATPLLGEAFCADVSFTNSDNSTGFGPYLLLVLDDGIDQLTADFVDIAPQLTPIGTFDSSGVLVDPITGANITGNAGGTAWIVRYPVGSVDQGQPPLVMTLCAAVEPGAEIGAAKPFDITPGFEFGDTTTGTNGPIAGTTIDTDVTPQLARIAKTNSAPEGERPPGPSNTFLYTWSADISEGVSLDNILVSDVLPAAIQWTGDPIAVSAPLSTGCVTTNPNSPTTPGGTVSVSCTSILGSASAEDFTVTVPVYITDILNEATPDSQSITNTLNFAYDYLGTAFADSASSTVTAEHATVQKSVSGTGLPGGILTYVFNFQVTDYPDTGGEGASTFVLSDTLPDGLNFDGTVALVIDGAIVPITATATPGSGPGETDLIWDVAAVAPGGQLNNGSQGSITFEATILEDYADGSPVQAADGFDNNVTLDYVLTSGATGSNGSAITAPVEPNVPDKTIFSPNPLPSALEPGEEVVFELSLSIPAGNTGNVTFVDFLPRPVFEVTDFNAGSDVTILPPFTALTPTITTNTSDNSVRLEFGDVDTNIATTLRVRLAARLVGTPFADSLFLTNLLQTSYETSDGRTITDLQAAGATIGAPSLNITKGVIAAANSGATILPAPPGDPSTALADSDVNGVDAFDEITYLITVENIGTTPAYNVTIDDPAVSGLSCSEPTVGDIENGNGADLTFSGTLATGIVLDARLEGNDGSEGAPFAGDTALMTLRCTLESTVEPRQTIDNTAGVTWTSTADPSTPFTRITESASVVIADPTLTKTVTAITPGYSTATREAHIGELVTYQLVITVPEGTSSSVRVQDILPNGMAFTDVVSVVASSGALGTSIGSFNDVIANAGFNNQGGGVTAPDRRLVFGPGNNNSGLGTITNSDRNNAIDETITITYRSKVLNASVNTSGRQRRNRARWLWQPPGDSRRSVQVRAAPVRIVEARLRLAKTFTPNTGDSSTPPLVTLRLNHTGGSTADAFDVSLSDLLPDNMRVDGAVDTSNCPALPDNTTVTDNGLSDNLQAQWSSFPEGSTCTLRFQTQFTVNPNAGSAVQNCAESFWESLSDSDQPLLPSPPNNTLGVERTGNNADPGQLNNYQLTSCDTFNVFGVGIEKIVTGSDQAHTDSIAGTPPDTESLTIGETVNFDLILTIPEANVDNLEVTDLLPVTSDVLELISATTTFVGSDLTPSTLANTAATISDRDGDGVNDSALFNYGQVIQLADGTTDDDDRIRIAVVAKVRDVLVNQNNDLSSNTGIVRFLPSVTASDTAALELVEPLLSISKTADTSQAEAGDVVTYTISVEHTPASRIDARDLQVRDVIPSELNVLPGNVSLGGTCTTAPDTGPTLVAGELVADWTSFPLGAVCEIEFLATVDVSAVIGQTINNEGEIRWTSLDTQGDGDDREYDVTDLWAIDISEPGINKSITAVDIGDFVLGSPSQELTIGETVTFTIDADFPDGTTEQAFVSDRMPSTGVAFEITRTEVIAIGADLTLNGGVVVGDSAADCSAGAPQTCAEWALGNVINTPDSRPNPDTDDRITFEIDAIVLDNPLNTGAPGEDKNLQNRAQLRSNSVNVVSSARFDLIEPLLEITKLTENGERPAIVRATEQKRFTLRINHLAASTATARAIAITDVLNANMLWVADSTVSSTCPGFSITSSPADLTNGTVVFAVETLSLSERSCDISYDVEAINAGFPVPDDFPNVATLEWESAVGSAETRDGTNTDSNFLVSISNAAIGKTVSGTSVPGTQTGQGNANLEDVTIGEEIRYEVVASFSEGQQTNVVLTDTLQATDPAGPILELISGNVIFIGDNITTSLPGTPSIAGNVITVDYGTVDNLADAVLDENDTIVYELIARVVNVAGNVAGPNPLAPNTLRNSATLTFDGGAGSAPPVSIDVEIVEPTLAASKAFTDLTEGVATIEISITNTGTSDAYELIVTDEFSNLQWQSGTLLPITVPPGFTLTENTAAGATTVTLETVGNPARPEEVLAPGETVTVSFSMELVDGALIGLPSLTNTANAQATSLPGINPEERTYTATASDALLFPDLVFEKTWSALSPVRPGDTVTYTLTLTNDGPGVATGVVIADTPDVIGEFQAGTVVASGSGTVTAGNSPTDTELSVTYASIAGSSTETVTYEVQIPLPYPSGASAPEQISNQATVDAKEQAAIVSDDPTTVDPDDATVVPIVADPAMRVVKDDQVTLSAPGTVIEYLITYGNVGNQDATGVVITETVPDDTVYTAANSSPGWSCADGSGPGTICTFTVGDLSLTPGSIIFAVLVDDPLDAGVTQIDNLVTITDDGNEFDPGAPVVPSTDSDTEETPIGGAFPQLRIEKDDGGIGVTPGQRYSYLIEYSNIGNQGATGVVITETVPEDVAFSAVASLPTRWSCPDGSPPGTSCSITVPLLIALASDNVRFGLDVNFPAAAGRELIINNVDITDDGANSLAPSTDADTDDTPLIAVPDIYVTKETSAGVVSLGDNIIYTAVYGNRGNQNATGVIVREAVPAGSTYNAANSAPTSWSCADGDPEGTVCEYLGGAVAVGFMETLMFSIDIVDTPRDRQILNIIEANDDMSNGADPVPGDNRARVVNRFPALSVDTLSRGSLAFLSLMLLLMVARQRRLQRYHHR